MAVDSGQIAVHAAGVVVVQKQAHAHAAVGGGQHFLHQQAAGKVFAPDVVADVERHLGVVDQLGTGHKGVLGVVDHIQQGRQAAVAGGMRLRRRLLGTFQAAFAVCAFKGRDGGGGGIFRLPAVCITRCRCGFAARGNGCRRIAGVFRLPCPIGFQAA